MHQGRSRAVVTRRQTLGFLGAAGVAAFVGAGSRARSAVSCADAPSQTIGPYFVEEGLDRSDITVDPSDGSVQAGVPLRLALALYDVDDACAAVAGAQVDVWHASAAGLYSDEATIGTTGKKYLRGSQVSDANGAVAFATVYPGWYQGRAVHIHFRIRLFDGAQTTYDFISQLYFDEAVTDQVYAQAPYSSRGARDTLNAADGIYTQNGSGAQLLLVLSADGSGGWIGTFDVGLTGLPAPTGTTTTTSTMLLPSACGSGVDFTTALCRVTELHDAVTAALADGALRRRLLRAIDRRVQPRLAAAQAAVGAGKGARARRQVALAAGGLRTFSTALASRAGRVGADAATRAALGTTADSLRTLVLALRATLS